MSKLEPGMLALVIGACHCTENIGKIVKVEGFYKAGEILPNKTVSKSDVFFCSGDNLVYALVRKGTQELLEKIPGCAFCWPKHLMPIKPESDPLETKQEQELHA